MKRLAYWAVYALWLFFVTLSAPLIWICWVLANLMDSIDPTRQPPSCAFSPEE